jgi:hypothetical protein
MLLRMHSGNYREFAHGRQPRVEVLADDRWREGVLVAWEKLGGEWWAHVHYGPDEVLRLFDTDRVRGTEAPSG